jgi:hypothetical protein
MFSESTCSGVSKISHGFFVHAFWVNKSLSMMCPAWQQQLIANFHFSAELKELLVLLLLDFLSE